ncbi:S-layer homology domain-containing protein [Capilliphycus salinus ALCB114379]|uniref:S-layer homology domain-containing protein n=1 Tax=Capilliphycus salinus TaxID=2768948 RepID=UPI0039A48B97
MKPETTQQPFVNQFPDNVWSDINDHWAENCLNELGFSGLFSGYPDRTFKPNKLMTRAEFAAALKKAFPDTPAKRQAIKFSDVSSNFWAFEAIRWAYERQFLSGYPGGVFKPQENIPRVQALVALASGLNLSANPQLIDSFSQLFEDAKDIPNYANSGVAATLEKRIIASPNNPRQLKPNQPATRAEVAVFIAQSRLQPGQIDRVNSQVIIEPVISPDFLPPNPWKNNQLYRTLSKPATAIAWSYNEEVIGSYQPQTGIQLWDVKTGNSLEIISEETNHRYLSFALNNTGESIAFYDYNSEANQLSLKLFNRKNKAIQNVETIQIIDNFTLDEQFLTLLEFSPKGEILATFVESVVRPQRIEIGTLKIWNIKEVNRIQTFSITPKISKLVFSPNSELFASYHSQGQVKVWKVGTAELLYTLNEETVIDDITFSLDSQFLLSAVISFVDGFPIDTYVRVWEMSTGMLQFNFDLSVDRTSRNRSLSRDGTTYFASGEVAGASFFNVGNNNTFNFTFPPNVSPLSIYNAKQNLFSPQGRLFSIATSEGVFIWNSSY